MPMMSIALANSISTTRYINTCEYNNRRHVVTPISSKKRKYSKENIMKTYCSKFINCVKNF